ncbi:unnamed protein product [Protopolystoma xenopodis]|uniref:Uncharacterized protein n=1 Tax=Protopolystoma xenopodis TaxID=117903 RepID=A0A3S5BM75_9PLAT|nr:unnamed protein product [Protopolystoma xenopodis]
MEVKLEISEVQEDHTRERQEHERVQEELTREVKLRQLILENFLPLEEREKLKRRAFFDESEEAWRLRPLLTSSASAGEQRGGRSSHRRNPNRESARDRDPVRPGSESEAGDGMANGARHHDTDASDEDAASANFSK